ncbi:hypothetical protein N7522_005354 [Penicillium canescens]|uniref:Uncharacterized protein n=1 Tax=Penicillium canescens TaxID=5083 RepID=A0AAD6IJ19_PENCN|nr:uncharacterized protein N7446_011136 [Penicillium canescens]KAJ6007003.1 hypothetical protein N7522_005354 [Penicillium canescens]KAJ6029516.1 hypothetical protein N7444_012503 [Penicillium canescens]KAJ6047947.1 hypothetical protein N7460_004094 [Penicillium canescens]KAJ6048453.1 hypothetical protein N7446_011136 [Penicillium canescens]
MFVQVDEITFPGLPTSTRIESSQHPGREVTADMLTTDRVPWDVSPNDPAVLSISNEYGGVHSIQLHTFCQGSRPDGEKCPVCFEEDSDTPIILQCDTFREFMELVGIPDPAGALELFGVFELVAAFEPDFWGWLEGVSVVEGLRRVLAVAVRVLYTTGTDANREADGTTGTENEHQEGTEHDIGHVQVICGSQLEDNDRKHAGGIQQADEDDDTVTGFALAPATTIHTMAVPKAKDPFSGILMRT